MFEAPEIPCAGILPIDANYPRSGLRDLAACGALAGPLDDGTRIWQYLTAAWHPVTFCQARRDGERCRGWRGTRRSRNLTSTQP